MYWQMYATERTLSMHSSVYIKGFLRRGRFEAFTAESYSLFDSVLEKIPACKIIVTDKDPL